MPAGDAAAFLSALEATSAEERQSPYPSRKPLLPYLARRSPEVDDIGACNTLVREAGGWMGYNTDAQGFERALFEFLGGDKPRGLKATLVGAGGVAKAIAHVLSRLGVRTVILNRTVSKARVLSQRYGFALRPLHGAFHRPRLRHADLVIQATVVGMDGERQGDPLDWYDFSGRESVFDLIYRPERSLLLERAAAAGCRIMNGWKMLRYQSAAQFALWTGLEPPSTYFS